MRTYHYECSAHGPIELEVGTLEEFEEVTTVVKRENLLECPKCGNLCHQDYSKKNLSGYVSDSTIVGSSNAARRRANEEKWMQSEIDVSKKSIHNTTEGASPYSTMKVNYENLVDGGTKNPNYIEQGLDYRRKTSSEMDATSKQVGKLNEKSRKKSEENFGKK